MGLFSKLRNMTKPNDSGIAAAVLVPSVSTMIADGEVNDAELLQLSNVCAFSPIFLPLGADAVMDMAKDIIDDISREGHMPVIERAVAKLSPALRETALCYAMRIALADGHLDDGEKAALSATAGTMDVSVESFNKIFEVVVMMQRPETA